MDNEEYINKLSKAIKEGSLSEAIKVYGEGRKLENLSSRMPSKIPSYWERQLRPRISNFIWFTKIWFLKHLHHLFPSLHKWEWIGIQECSCCGFEGMTCIDCYSQIIIGDTAEWLYKSEILIGTRYENGD